MKPAGVWDCEIRGFSMDRPADDLKLQAVARTAAHRLQPPKLREGGVRDLAHARHLARQTGDTGQPSCAVRGEVPSFLSNLSNARLF
jgi:hypothetical protein